VGKVFLFVFLTCALAGCNSSTSTPTTPTTTPSPTPSTPTVTSVAVTSNVTAFTERGATARFTATATLSNGASEDRTSSATWRSDNTNVASVATDGTVTAQGDGQATITATVGTVQGSRGVSVALVRRTPDPVAGQRIPMPDIRATIDQIAARRPDLIAESCPRGVKYVTNPWLDYMVDELRKIDTRWGYNAKPNRTAVDNEGVPVVAAGDEIAYHFSAGPDQGSPDVYLIDILAGHCGPTPSLTFRVFTGEEPGRWTGAGRF
jgi:hypothetical protein